MAVEVLSVAKMLERVGEELGVTDWFKMDQDRINKFADCTEDHQWIHVDPEKAAQGPFGQTIAHGYLTISLLPYFSADYALVPEGTMMAINYGINKLRLVNPVKSDARKSSNPSPLTSPAQDTSSPEISFESSPMKLAPAASATFMYIVHSSYPRVGAQISP
jgi:hypothetical protein